MQLLSSTLLNMASQNLSSVTTVDLTALQRLTVKEAKRFYPEVKLTLLLPYHPAERPIPTPDGFDSTFYPPGMESIPRKIAIVRVNRYVVDHVDCLIAYAWHSASNAKKLVEYAWKRKKKNSISITTLTKNH